MYYTFENLQPFLFIRYLLGLGYLLASAFPGKTSKTAGGGDFLKSIKEVSV